MRLYFRVYLYRLISFLAGHFLYAINVICTRVGAVSYLDGFLARLLVRTDGSCVAFAIAAVVVDALC